MVHSVIGRTRQFSYWSMLQEPKQPWWPSCLDRGALNNVDAPGCGTSVVRGPTGHK